MNSIPPRPDNAQQATPNGGNRASGEPLRAALGTFRRWFGATYDLDVLQIVLATAAALQLDGHPPWLLVIGGSGAAKTETVAALYGAGDHVHVTSTITSDGALLSATQKRDQERDRTGGLLVKIGETGLLVIKDVTSILSMDRTARGGVLAALREVADGLWERNVGTGGGRTLRWKGRIGCIGAVTTAWDRAHNVISQMGDRFVLVRLDSTTGRREAALQALANNGDERQMRDELAQAVGVVLAAVDPRRARKPDAKEAARLADVADLVTRIRTGVDHDARGYVMDAQAPEMPTRFVAQLAQIYRGALSIGADRGHALELALRCARDTAPPRRLEVLQAVAELASEAQACSTTDVTRHLDQPRKSVERTLQELHLLGLLTASGEEESGRTGESRRRYRVAKDVDAWVLNPARAVLAVDLDGW